MIANLIAGAGQFALANRISLVGANTGTGDGSYSVLAPSGLQANDLLLAAFVRHGTDIDLSLSGFTEVADLAAGSGNLYVGYKVAVGSETSFSFSGNGVSGCAVVAAFRGVSTTTPIDAAAAPQTYGNGVQIDPSAYTPATNGAWIIVCAARGDLNTTFASISAASNMTSVGGTQHADPNDEGSTAIRVARKSMISAIEFNPGEFTCSRTIGMSATFALRPRP